MGIWPWDESGPAKTPLSKGYVIGKAAGDPGTSIALSMIRSEQNTAQLYDSKGNKKNGIWATTKDNGTFIIAFKWDNAMDLDVFINNAPTYAKILVCDSSGSYNRFWVQIGLVVNMYGFIKGESLIPAPPGGWFGNFMANKGRDWLFSSYPSALELLKRSVPIRTTDAYTALSVADTTDPDFYSVG